MSTDADAQRAPVPVWLFSSPEAIDAFVERASEIRTGNAEYDLFLVEVAGVIEECVALSPGWVARNAEGASVVLPKLHRHYVSLYPDLAGTIHEHLGHWLLRDAFTIRESLPVEIAGRMQEDGFSGPLALLAVDNCLLMLHHWRVIPLEPSLETQAASMQAALTHYARAAQSLAFLHQVIPFEAQTATSQACTKAQRAAFDGYAKLKELALAQWQEGVAAGRWAYGEVGNNAPRGRGPRNAARVITTELIPIAKKVLRGNQAKRGIAVGNEDEVYRWILEARRETANV